ncbi:Ig-like domain-containing protein [Pseudoneobacillus sp. C159]
MKKWIAWAGMIGLLLLPTREFQSVSAAGLDYWDIIEETEPNDDFEQANELPIGTVVSGTFKEEDVDIFKVTVSKSDKFVVLGHEQDDQNLLFILFNENEDQVEPSECAQSDNGATKVCIYDIPQGTYYIGTIDGENLATGEPYILLTSMLADFNLDEVDEGIGEEGMHVKGGIELDTTAPDAPIVNPVDDNDKVITGTAEPGSYVHLKLNGEEMDLETIAENDEHFSIKIDPQVAGTKIEVWVSDESGNQSKDTKTIVLDKTPPKSLVVSTITSSTKTITGKTEAKALVEVKVGTKVFGKTTADSKGNFKITIKNQKKGTKLTVVATDKAKNKKTVTLTVK